MLPSSSHTHLSDEALLQAYRSTGDNEWLGILLQRYTMLLLGVAMKYLKDRDGAHDAVQQVFLKALTHIPQGEIQNFKGWLYILMRNHCLQLLRDKTYLAGEEALSYVPAAPDERDEHLQLDLTFEHMTAAIAALAGDQRECITLFYLQKKSYQEITDLTGFTFAQVKSYIQNGKRNLRILVQKKLASKNRHD